MLELSVVEGDIAALDVDAIANAANDHLWMGAGVRGCDQAGGRRGDRARGGRERAYRGRNRRRDRRRPAPRAARDPRRRHGPGPADDRRADRQTTRSCLEVADGLGCESLALPAFGTGVGGFPLDECARIMVTTVHGYEPAALRRVVFALRGGEAAAVFAAALPG